MGVVGRGEGVDAIVLGEVLYLGLVEGQFVPEELLAAGELEGAVVELVEVGAHGEVVEVVEFVVGMAEAALAEDVVAVASDEEGVVRGRLGELVVVERGEFVERGEGAAVSDGVVAVLDEDDVVRDARVELDDDHPRTPEGLENVLEEPVVRPVDVDRDQVDVRDDQLGRRHASHDLRQRPLVPLGAAHQGAHCHVAARFVQLAQPLEPGRVRFDQNAAPPTLHQQGVRVRQVHPVPRPDVDAPSLLPLPHLRLVQRLEDRSQDPILAALRLDVPAEPNQPVLPTPLL
mmetsp:Transcript_8352/g.25909  ORF Transcript_8352/g.25909 Transcript_8352/m.25909 type:complete len:288 (+) Transcript_8352:2693-3556(+)